MKCVQKEAIWFDGVERWIRLNHSIDRSIDPASLKRDLARKAFEIKSNALNRYEQQPLSAHFIDRARHEMQ